ncbi:hypothetical protein PGB90_007782 [Kerria lacca]
MKVLIELMRRLHFAIIFFRFTVYWCKAIHSAKDVPVYYEQGIVGDRVYLPCDISTAEGPQETEDSAVLVLWYKENSGTPIYSVDNREKDYRNAEKWSDDKVFGHRAYFATEKQPAQLSVDNVKYADEGIYRCRVDFKFAQTRNSKVVLTVIVPPQKIIITDEIGKTRASVVGPYTEGSHLTLTCTVFGAKPEPDIIWFKRDQILQKKKFNSSSSDAVSLKIYLKNLTRSDLHAELTCQASNNNRTNLSAIVQIDMNFKPLDIQIFESNQPFTAERKYELICQSSGSRPPAKVTWWKDGERLDKTKDTTSMDGNTSTSILQFTPIKSDTGKHLSCKSENHQVNDDVLETGWQLKINYSPETRIALGSSLKADGIKEGADVYFDCIVNALPPSFKIDWKLNGQLLHHHVGQGTIISNHSLVLQKVTRKSIGNYTCKAYNTEGDGENSPTCKPKQTRVYGVAKLEKINITCEIEANPTDVVFKWSFNNSQESFNVSSNHVIKSGTTSIISHMPNTELDYGTLLCTASNKIGQQRIPCIYHIIAAGKPDKVSNCTVKNITAISFYIECKEGYNGGMPQTFYLEVKSESGIEVNVSSSVPRFPVLGLEAKTNYRINVYSMNMKGHSEPINMTVYTLNNLEQILNLKEAKKAYIELRLSVTTNIIIGIALSLIIVTSLVAATALQLRCIRSENKKNKNDKSSEESVFHCVNDNEFKSDDYHDDVVKNIVLNKNIALIEGSDEKNPDLIPHSTLGTFYNKSVYEHYDYSQQKSFVSTIQPKISTEFADFLTRGMLIQNDYPSSFCTLRNGRIKTQNYEYSSETNIVSIPKISESDAKVSWRYDDEKYSSINCSIPKSEFFLTAIEIPTLAKQKIAV